MTTKNEHSSSSSTLTPKTPSSSSTSTSAFPSLYPKMSSYETPKRWNRGVSIDSAFLNIMSTHTLATPNIRSGRIPSLGEAASGLDSSTGSQKLKLRDRWKASFSVSSRRLGQSLFTVSNHVTEDLNARIPSRERRGTFPAPLQSSGTGNEKGYLRVADAVFSKGRLKQLLLKRRSPSRDGSETTRGGGRPPGLLPMISTTSSSSSSPPPPPPVESPKGLKKGFKQLAQQVLLHRRLSGEVSGGGERGSIFRPKMADVLMHELVKQVDRKKLARLKHIAGLKAANERKRRLMRKFQMAVHITLWCIKNGRRHCVQAQGSRDLSSFFNMNFTAMDTFDGVDLLFDPSEFKANRQARIPKEMKRIFRKLPEERTEQEIYYAQIALRNIKCFAEFPDRMQKKIAEVGMYQKFEARRVLLRQGHPAHNYYFILSGAVSVLVVEEGGSFATLAAHLEKGETFGELAIIKRGTRHSSVVVKEKSEFLTISVDDYHKIFMCGGVKSVNDPDHERFIKSLPFLQGWPVQRLGDEDSKCVFLYFKRGDVIVRDSQYSDWIIVVKSGSLNVLKKLRKVEAYEWKKPKVFTFVSDKEKRARHLQLTKMRKQILPELQIPLRESTDDTHPEDLQIREEGKLRPFVHPEPYPSLLLPAEGGSSEDVKVWDLGGGGGTGGGTTGKGDSGLEAMSYLHVPQDDPTPDVKVTAPAQEDTSVPSAETAEGEEEREREKNGDEVLPSGTIAEENRSGWKARVGARTVSQTRQHAEDEIDERRSSSRSVRSSPKSPGAERLEKGNSASSFQPHVRTIQQELEDFGIKRDPDDISAADLNPEFVQVQTLTKGMCFGLSDLILGEGSNFCVVSNGADVLLVNKTFYHDHASEGLIRRMRQALCPYPSEEELQNRLQTSVDWDAYRQSTLANTLKFVRQRKDTPV